MTEGKWRKAMGNKRGWSTVRWCVEGRGGVRAEIGGEEEKKNEEEEEEEEEEDKTRILKRLSLMMKRGKKGQSVAWRDKLGSLRSLGFFNEKR